MLDDELCDRGFTDSSIGIIEQLVERAADRTMFIRPEYIDQVAMLLLWSLLRWECKVGLAAIKDLGVDVDQLAQEVDRALRTMPLPAGAHSLRILQVRSALEPLLVQAEHEAQTMAHDWIGSEHLMLALLRHPCIELQQLWSKHGVTYVRAKAAVIDILKN